MEVQSVKWSRSMFYVIRKNTTQILRSMRKIVVKSIEVECSGLLHPGYLQAAIHAKWNVRRCSPRRSAQVSILLQRAPRKCLFPCERGYILLSLVYEKVCVSCGRRYSPHYVGPIMSRYPWFLTFSNKQISFRFHTITYLINVSDALRKWVLMKMYSCVIIIPFDYLD